MQREYAKGSTLNAPLSLGAWQVGVVRRSRDDGAKPTRCIKRASLLRWMSFEFHNFYCYLVWCMEKMVCVFIFIMRCFCGLFWQGGYVLSVNQLVIMWVIFSACIILLLQCYMLMLLFSR